MLVWLMMKWGMGTWSHDSHTNIEEIWNKLIKCKADKHKGEILPSIYTSGKLTITDVPLFSNNSSTIGTQAYHTAISLIDCSSRAVQVTLHYILQLTQALNYNRCVCWRTRCRMSRSNDQGQHCLCHCCRPHFPFYVFGHEVLHRALGKLWWALGFRMIGVPSALQQWRVLLGVLYFRYSLSLNYGCTLLSVSFIWRRCCHPWRKLSIESEEYAS
jgi:hypothetical protein